jgi:hypothetical protein
MKISRICSVALSLAISATAVTLVAQAPVTPTPVDQRTPAQLKLLPKALAKGVPDIPVKVVPDFMKFRDPNSRYLMGEGIGIARNSKGMIYVNTCSQQTRVLEFDPNGYYVREIGKDLVGLIWCHGVRVDAQDNIWAIDGGSNTIIKFNPAGRVQMVIGRRPEYPVSGMEPAPAAFPDSATAPKYIFRRQTDVAFDAQGNIFVADGYVNARVVKYDKEGRFVAQAGSAGSGPGQLSLAHAVAVAPNGDVYVGSRSDQRIVVFDNNLKYKTVLDQTGAPWSLCIGPASRPYLWTSNSNPDSQNSPLHEVSGQIFKMELDGTVVGKFGVPGKEQGQFSTVHGIDCSVENEILTTEITQWRFQKFILQPTAAQGGR